MVEEKEKKVERKKSSDDTVKSVENLSVKSLRLDIALCEFVHQRTGRSVRMKEIMSELRFSLLSEQSIRRHLKSLVARGVLEESLIFRGSYTLCEQSYDEFIRDLSRYLKKIVGDEFYETIIGRLRPRSPY